MFRTPVLGLSVLLVCSGAEALAQSQGDQRPPVEFLEYGVYQQSTFSRNGRHFATIDRGNGHAAVLLDGVRGKRYDSVSSLMFSPDQERVAYVASEGGESFVVDGTNEGVRHGEGEIGTLRFTPDGDLFYSILQGTHGWRVFSNGALSEVYNTDDPRTRLHPLQVTFSTSPPRLAYVASRDQRQFMVVDGKEQERTFSLIAGPRLSSDGQQLAYWGWKGKVAKPGTWGRELQGADSNWDLIVDDIVVLRSQFPCGSPIFSPDGKHLAVTVVGPGSTRDQTEILLYVDGKEVGEIPDGVGATVGFAVDSQLPVFVTSEGGKPVLRVGSERFLDPVCCVDSNHKRVAYAVRAGKRWRLIEWAPIDHVEPGPTLGRFHRGGRFAFLLTEEKRTHLVVDGVRRASPSGVQPRTLSFSGDGHRLNYVVDPLTPGLASRDAFLVMNGVAGKRHRRIEHVLFSRDGTRSAYQAHDADAVVHYIDEKIVENSMGVGFTVDGREVHVIPDSSTGSAKIHVAGHQSPPYAKLRRIRSALTSLGRVDEGIFLGDRGGTTVAVVVKVRD